MTNPVTTSCNNQIDRELMAGEKLLWSGKPNASKLFSPSDAFLIPFSLLWGGFAYFWEATVIVSGAPLLFKLWGIPFVVIGTYMIFGRFFVKRRINENTAYAITDKRVLIVTTWPTRNLTALDLRTLPSTTLREGNDGGGHIVLGTDPFGMACYADTGMDLFGQTRGAPALRNLANVRRVYEQIEKARQNALGVK